MGCCGCSARRLPTRISSPYSARHRPVERQSLEARLPRLPPLCLAKLLLRSLHRLLSLSCGSLPLVHPILSLSQFAAGSGGVLLCYTEILLRRFRARPLLAKAASCLLESLAILLPLAFLRGPAFTQARGRLPRSGGLPLRRSLPGRLLLRRRSLGARTEKIEARGFEVAGESASCEQLPALA